MVDIEELKRQFKVANVAGVGQCIIIPMDNFDPAWDEELLQQHIECHAREDGYVQVVLGPEKDPEKQKPKKQNKRKMGARWEREDEERLLKRVNELTGPVEPRLKKLLPEFPDRTFDALRIRYDKIRQAAKLEKKAPSKAETPAPGPDSNVTKILGKLTSDVDGILDILDEQNKVMDKLSCQILMQALELKEQKGEIKLPLGLWIHYADALLEDDKKFCNIFREKVKHLLEASA